MILEKVERNTWNDEKYNERVSDRGGRIEKNKSVNNELERSAKIEAQSKMTTEPICANSFINKGPKFLSYNNKEQSW